MEAEAEDTPKEEQKVLDAGEVFLLMKKDYRISRNIRSQWFFSNLHRTVQVTPDDQLPESDRELENESYTLELKDLQVLSVLPQGWKGEPVDTNTSYRLVHTSKATFLARRYRFVFALDLSPSTSSVDGCRGRVMLEEVFAALENCLSGLTEPYSAPGSNHVFRPQIYVTVIAYTPLISYKTQQVIIQGCLVTQSNLPALLATVRQQFYEVENKIAEGSRVAMQGREGLSGGMFDDIVDPLGGKKAWDAMVTPDVGLVNMLRYGILALQLLPDNTSARIVVITDGVTAMPNMEMMESLLVQLRSSTIACSFLQLGSAYRPSMSMGYVLHNQLLKFLAAATFGAYLEFCPSVGKTAEGMNTYQKALFEWHFQKGLSELPLKAMRGQFSESVAPSVPDPEKPRWMWNEKAMSACPIMRKKHSETTLQVSIFNVLAVRLREGYTIKEVNMTKNDTQIEVKVVLPWKHDVTLEYTASSAWPPKDTKRITQVEVSLEGSYDFLHDITCPMKKPFKSAYRTSVVKRFWQTVHGVSRTDQLLVHIQSFASNPRYYVVPESVWNGVPLFYMSHSSAAPVPSLQHSEMKETGLAEFAAFWQPMVQLDTNVWQRWLHTHRITILLTHDKPLPYHLHIPGPNGRYDTIQCRVSFTEVHKLLSKETSFVLVESYCYVKLLFSNKDKPPTSFFVVRVSSKPPCMVVRLAFLGGTPGHVRNEIVTDIKEKLNTLSKRAHKVETPKGKPSPSKQEKTEQGQAERACLVLQAKPLEKMLIRYEKVPSDYTNLYSASVEAPAAARVGGGGSAPLITVNKTATTMFGTLSRYLYHQRWVWGIQLSPAAPVTAQDAARILATLTKTRLREGFSFAHCYSGMVSMVAEVHMRDPLRGNTVTDSEGGVFSCFLQYVLFPPHTCTTKDSVTSISTDDDELETTEADGELQIVVECWIEPQCGVVIDSPASQRHLEGLEYQDIPQALLPFDSHVISSLVTFQHLFAMCGNRCVPPPTVMEGGGSGRTTPTIADFGATDSNIKHLFFPFDLVELLPHCQKVSMQFQACRQEEEPQEGETQPKGQQANRDLFKLMHDRLAELTHRELPLSEDVSASFTKTLTTEVNISADHKADDTIVEDTESAETEAGKAAAGGKKTEEDSSTPQTETKSLADAILEEQVPTVEWKCYMKSVRAGNVVLTVLPKTYQDVVVFDNYRKRKEEEARLLKEEDGVQRDESADRAEQEMPTVLTEIEEVEEFKSLESVEEMMATGEAGEDDGSEPSLSESDAQAEDNIEAVEDEIRQDEVEEKEEVEDTSASVSPPVTIPIYVFSCQQSCLLRQLELGIAETTPETVRDHRFDREGFLVRSNSQFSDFWKSRESVRLNADQRVDSRETIDEDFSSGDSFKDFCDQISDGIQQSYVTAVFQSLQDGVPLDHQDVQAAVENVCEEQLHEIDITEFLGTLCGHLSTCQHLRRHRLDSTSEVDLNETKESIDTVVDVEDKTKYFSLSSLPTGCESSSELHKTIKEKFAQAVGKYFQPVPSSPDLYFYCSPRQNQRSSRQPEEPADNFEDESPLTTEEEDNAQSDSEHIRIESVSDSDIVIEDTLETTEDEDDEEEDDLRDGHTETLGSISVQSEFGSRESVVLEEAASGSVPPLFLNLTCSLRCGSHRGSMSVTQDSLPTCVKDVSACLDPSVKELDLSDFYVTLDIICLTLPGVTSGEDSAELRPELNRMTSSDTNISSPVGSPQDFQTPRSTEQDFFSETHLDPLDGLPEAHRRLVLDFVDQVNFLLKDEITAALRLIRPVTIQTLEKVAAHVHDSSCRLETGLSANPLDLPLTIQEDVPLQFVFGSDQSLERFVVALDDLQLPGYRLEKVWPWYYTALDPTAPIWKRKPENLNDSLPLSSVSNSEEIISPRSSRDHSDSVSTSYSGRDHSDSFATVVENKIAKQDSNMAASPRQDTNMATSPRQDTNMATSPRQDTNMATSPRQDTNMATSPRQDTNMATSPRQDTNMATSPRQDTNMATSPRQDTNMATSPRQDTNMAASPRQDANMAASPRQDSNMATSPIQDSNMATSPIQDSNMAASPGQDTNMATSPREDTNMAASPRQDANMAASPRQDSNMDSNMAASPRQDTNMAISPRQDTNMAATPTEESSISSSQQTSKNQTLEVSSEEQLLGLPLPMDTWECEEDAEKDEETAVEKAIDSTELIDQGLEEQDFAKNAAEGDENAGDKTIEGVEDQHGSDVCLEPPTENRDQQGKNERQSDNKEEIDQTEPVRNVEKEKAQAHADEISDKTLENASGDETEPTKQETGDIAESLNEGEPVESLPSEQTTDNLKNDDGTSLQPDDSKSAQTAKPEGPVLPNFWLIMKVSTDNKQTNEQTDKVEMFCHARKGNMDDHSTLFETLGDKIRNSCKLVNQKMLLQDLHDTRTCNSLLVAEDDEDIWLKDDYGPGGGQIGVAAISSAEDFAEKKKYLAATMQFMPGYFACECVWRVHFSIHQRLKTGPARGVSRGQQALRSALSAFSVNNQKNMFVFQERTGAVFYLQLFESMCVSGSHNTLNLPEIGKGEDENSLLSSRTSSLLSLPIRGGAAELEEDIREYQQAVEKDSGMDTVSQSQTGSMSAQGQAEESVVLMVHGVQPAGAEIRIDLVQILQHRLDDATLDVISLMLARNPMCRLSPADVLFIQPPSELPTHTLRLAVPAQLSSHIQAVDFYLKQNLLQFLHNPKFSDSVHFQDVDRKTVPQTDQDVFLYNRPQESGGKGIACIILGHVDSEGNYIQPPPAPMVSVEAYKVAMTWSNFKPLIETHRLEAGCCSSPDGGAILQFHIWERGDIDFPQLAEKIGQALQHALCDVITEYYMLTAPIAELEEDGEEEEDLMEEELMMEGDVSSGDGRQLSEESAEGLEPLSEATQQANLTWKEREIARRKEEDHKSLLWKLQSGSEGVLHTMYMGRVQRWFDFMYGINSPSVVRDTQSVDSRYAIPILLRELCDLVHLLAKDNTLRVFKHCQEHNYTLLKVPKGPPKTEEVCHAPGLADNYILLARSLRQWRECMDVKYGDLGADEEKPLPPVSYKGVQKFKAQERKGQEKVAEGAGPSPRQRLMIVEIRDTQITTYQYNWAGDLSVTLRQQLAQLSQWHNARSHLLQSLLVQKLGLFHHHPYQVENAANPFLRYSQDADLLVKCSAPPVKELQARAAQGFRGSVLFHPALRKFDQCLRDVHLRCPMHQAPYAGHPNPVFRHGIQAQEARNIEWGEYDTIHKLKSLYLMWQHRSGQVNVPIPDDLIDLMKMQSRLVHYCTTPLLYHPFWLDQENGKASNGRVARKAAPSDDAWLVDLSSSFLQQYIQYLQSLGFVLVQTRPPSPRRMARMQRHSKYHAPSESSIEKTTTHHLQRTIPGGVLFMELSLHSQFFTVRQFALESHRLGLPVNSHLAVVFTDECDKYKDLKHLHSFSHDFHLRCAALYMSGRQLIFPQCYDLSTFLAGVVNFFSRPPRFSQNHILSDTITEECPKLEASQLFSYTLEHADSYGFKSLAMSGPTGDMTQEQDFALINLSTGATPHPEVANLPMNDFDVSLFVVRQKDPAKPPAAASVLTLQYYVILTSRRDMFPRLTVDEKIAFRTRAGRAGGHHFSRPEDDMPPWLQLLLSESVTARQKISGTIDDAQLHCRRDQLWNRLQFEKPAESEERKGRRSESDEKSRRESLGNAKLSFDEFQELMSLVVSRALTDMDPSLTTLLSMGTAWYQGLLRVLQSRFPAKSRHFSSPDTHHHYLAVLSNHEDNFILLHMNTQTRFAELSAVFRVENQQSLATNGDGSPASDLQRHLEAVVNAAAFHLWSSLL